jgi:hypothetical protein
MNKKLVGYLRQSGILDYWDKQSRDWICLDYCGRLEMRKQHTYLSVNALLSLVRAM